jgi:hypothetical protein
MSSEPTNMRDATSQIPESASREKDGVSPRANGHIQFCEDGLITEVHLLGQWYRSFLSFAERKGRLWFVKKAQRNNILRVYNTDDGRLHIDIDERRPDMARLLGNLKLSSPSSQVDIIDTCHGTDARDRRAEEDKKETFPLHLNIVIQIIGSRGDIQPFIAIGKVLKERGHRVRLATHFAFRDFALDSGLEFFNIGGDAEQLMSFMVKNPGLIPGMETMRSGAIQNRRQDMKEIFYGCWESCFKTGEGANPEHNDHSEKARRAHEELPFVADAIIANPPSLANIHCAQRLGVPLHIMFT